MSPRRNSLIWLTPAMDNMGALWWAAYHSPQELQVILRNIDIEEGFSPMMVRAEGIKIKKWF